MGLSGLSVCACGHVANHHGDRHGCHVAGCPCRRFDAGHVSLERHNEVVREANRRIKGLIHERQELRDALRDAAFILREEFGRNTDHLDRLVGER